MSPHMDEDGTEVRIALGVNALPAGVAAQTPEGEVVQVPLVVIAVDSLSPDKDISDAAGHDGQPDEQYLFAIPAELAEEVADGLRDAARRAQSDADS